MGLSFSISTNAPSLTELAIYLLLYELNILFWHWKLLFDGFFHPGFNQNIAMSIWYFMLVFGQKIICAKNTLLFCFEEEFSEWQKVKQKFFVI